MNDKDNNYVLKLSHILLSKIIGLLNKNIDKICFSLVCKQLYQQRDKYIFLNCDNISQRHSNSIDNEYPRFQLNSYKNILKRSLELKSNCSLLIVNTNHLDGVDFDYLLITNDLKELEIPSTVTKLDIHSDFTHDLDSEFKSKLERSNVNQLILDSRNILFDRFPSNINTLPSSLPSTLRKLSISFRSLNSSKRDYLPASLTKLSVFFANDDVIDRDDYIPQHVRSLSLSVRNQQLSKAFIPRGVRKLTITGSVSLDVDTFSELDQLEALDLIRVYSCEGNIADSPVCIFPADPLDYLLNGRFSELIQSDMLPRCRKLVFSYSCDIESIPDGVETLALLSNHHLEWKNLPSSVRTLTISQKSLQLNGVEGIPSNITNIRLKRRAYKCYLRRLNDHQFLLCGSGKHRTNDLGAIINQCDLLNISL
ncbi:hypothetical protein PPL_08246 [Heterostelium album PN500]|uniref:Uncharacterized protein n=1 Tax=Heterostelium pallidum (strain ATCC 26659 / Pp 5 / PN500) TaxID=670386 RepID=D3BJ09_HETP5|nr:hypothetical protein PPL_08246 [Heterostelium album PN500]EFA78783.1 hypothetical protein PPL_08246 [Heterostelium album PN500]|eukprot:XP_020430907.1 hypothetical protein PPL_08246 [Heterostelium album PN500]